ncbi:hypothetical protein H6F67_22200 [Microcoleus sp. FACHB-1515]|uniref:hypothetical protein n=1 Tax=Cyanophyceae TaxID=3028117 RepID=UPI00168526E9|nr:hypothetical protein [Microcoleus sp. FACHB-1515]MBD2092564.1 hypothetical protein [Microcoleus sp. FACHB-1515]
MKRTQNTADAQSQASESSASSGRASGRKSESSNQATVGNATRQIVRVLYWLVIIAALWFAYLNINPYAQAVRYIMDGTLDRTFFGWLLQLPIVGNLLNFFALGAHWLIGLILWAVIQTIECFPIVLKHDRSFQRAIINDSDRNQQYAISEDDDPAVQWLKRWYNRFPTLTIRKARNLALFAYTADFLICLSVYPPVDGGVSQFLFVVATGQFQLINWSNVALMMTTLFAFEAIVHMLFFLAHITWYYRLSRSAA